MPLSQKQFAIMGTKGLRAKFKTEEDFKVHMKRLSMLAKEAKEKKKKRA